MIITQARKVRTTDPSAFAWAGLRRFQNVELVTKELMEVHRVPSKFRDDVKKQAQQLRHCLVQAREYFAAAQAVSLATKPNLLYYGIMSLALAEILYKQDGMSSLDKARAEHRHHGLTMSVEGVARDPELLQAASALRAYPVTISGKRKGTFELWHQTSREHPLAGNSQRNFETGGSTTRFEVIFGPLDTPYSAVPESGMTLCDCISALPAMAEYANSAGVPAHFARGMCQMQLWPGEHWRAHIFLTLHPGPLNSILIQDLRFNPNDVERIELAEIQTGLQIRLQSDWVNGHTSLPLPPAATLNTDEWRMWTNKPPLNEYGYFYVALFLAGNYARYYPDRWLLDIERTCPLALAIEEICTIAEWRVPWLALCELGRNLLVLEA